jgi:hypothetical protein
VRGKYGCRCQRKTVAHAFIAVSQSNQNPSTSSGQSSALPASAWAKSLVTLSHYNGTNV